MRVIAGSAKGRRLRTVAGQSVRPTADKVKGALFNILASRFSLDGTHVLDLFAGSGALGIEALSRGAAHAVFVEQAGRAVHALRENLQRCGFVERARVLDMSVPRALTRLAAEHARFDGVLLDPPYGQGLAAPTLRALVEARVVRAGGWVVVEHHADDALPEVPGALHLTPPRRYGKTRLTLLVTEQQTQEIDRDRGQMTRAVYAGSFDPITNGHLDVVRRALQVFDHVIVAVAGSTSDPAKDGAFFSAAERVEMIREAVADVGDRVSVDAFGGLLVDYCDGVDARVIIRGLRAVSDFEYEFQMAMMNRHLKPHIETVFMTASSTYFYTSSRLVKEVSRLGGDVSGLLPDGVLRRLRDKFASRT
jgi:pantetheine-phosphate adenylyltransferase